MEREGRGERNEEGERVVAFVAMTVYLETGITSEKRSKQSIGDGLGDQGSVVLRKEDQIRWQVLKIKWWRLKDFLCSLGGNFWKEIVQE